MDRKIDKNIKNVDKNEGIRDMIGKTGNTGNTSNIDQSKEKYNQVKSREKDEKINSLVVIRADDMSRVKTALYDLIRYANLTFVGNARVLEPAFADNILVSIMKCRLKNCCDAAAIVPLADEAVVTIGRIRKIHPPAHLVVVSPRYQIFGDLVDSIEVLPEIELDIKD